MRKRLALIPAIAAGALGWSIAGPDAEASHIPIEQELINKAHKIQDYAGELSFEFRRHYIHLSTYRHLMADLNQLCVKAQHIDRLAHDPRGQVTQLRASVRDVDRLVHHLHDLVDASERRAAGHIHGRTDHVHEVLRLLTRTIHRFDDAIASLQRPAPACRNANRGFSPGNRGPRRSTRHPTPGPVYSGNHFNGSHPRFIWHR